MKYCGKVGYIDTIETGPGIWKTKVIDERVYFGDVITNYRRYENAQNSTNDNLLVNNSISIMADEYAYNHFSYIGYLEWGGALWKVTNVEIRRPRLILTLGGLYNGETPDRTSEII